MKTITFRKGLPGERTVSVQDIKLPDGPKNSYPEDNGIYALMVLAHDAILRGNPSPIWKTIRVPDMWHRSAELRTHGKTVEGQRVLDMWHMTADMVRFLAESVQ